MRLSLSALLLSLPVAISAAFAQSAPIAWDRALEFPGEEAVRPVDALPTPDGGLVVVAISFTNAGDDDSGAIGHIRAVSLSANGDERWRWSVGATDSGPVVSAFGSRRKVSAVVGIDGTTHITWASGARSFLASIDSNGTVLTNRILDGGTPALIAWEAAGIGITPAGDLRIGGTHRVGSAYESHFTRLDAVDPDGTFLWQYASGFLAPLATNDVLVASDGTTYLLGQAEMTFFGTAWRSSVTVLSPQGFLLGAIGGTLSAPSAFFHAAESTGGGVAFAGASRSGSPAISVMVLDGSSVRWRARENGVAHAFDVAMTSNEEVFVATGQSKVSQFDVTGALPGLVFPDGNPGSIGAYAVTARDDDHVLVHGGDATRVATTLFDPNGNVAWTTIRPGNGTVPIDQNGDGPELDVVVGAFGNVFTTYRAEIPGPSGPVLTVGVQKLLDGAPIGQTYCDPAVTNSTGLPGRIEAFGSDVRADNNVSLVSTQLPAGSFGLLITSRTQASVPLPSPSVGILCIGGTIGRFLGTGEVRPADASGSIVLQADLGAIPEGGAFSSAMAGETWNFQTWYRDVVGGAQTPNATDGVEILLR